LDAALPLRVLLRLSPALPMEESGVMPREEFDALREEFGALVESSKTIESELKDEIREGERWIGRLENDKALAEKRSAESSRMTAARVSSNRRLYFFNLLYPSLPRRSNWQVIRVTREGQVARSRAIGLGGFVLR
jgi:hypothetical protein